MKMNLKTRGISIAVISLFIIAMFFISVAYCSNRISRELERQLQVNLEDVANQNALAIRNQVSDNYVLMKSLMQQLKEFPGDMAENVSLLKGFAKAHNLKRIGYCALDGTTYTTDDVVANLSFREFFQRGLEGKPSITGALKDVLREESENVIIISAPMYDDDTNELTGVFGLIYDADVFNASLQIACFEGEGSSFAINEDGDITVAMDYDSVQLSQNLYSDILKDTKNNESTINAVKNQIASGSSSFGKFYIDTDYYYYCTPVSLADGEITWYVFTMVPASHLHGRISPIKDTLFLMIFLSIIIISIALGSYALIFSSQRKLVQRLAFTDPVTGGSNYAHFCKCLQRMRNRRGYLVAMDIQHFGNISIAMGSSASDEMIKKTWDLLVSLISDSELAGRVRDDYFVLFLNAPDDEALSARLGAISEKVHDLAISYQVPGVRACFGVVSMDNGTSIDDSYSKARLGREFAKSGQNSKCFAFYNELDHEELIKNQQLEDKFDEALLHHNFELWYQPKYSTQTHELVGSEALVRWREDDGTLIPPGRFIPLFEQNGYISRLDEYVFREACRQQRCWIDSGYRAYPVSINVSRATLYGNNVVEKYIGILNEYRLLPEYIQLEVLESAISGKANIAALLEHFRTLGIRILMDDFGTGYSSLATLNMHCFDTLKLDKSLIDCIGDKDGETLLHYVIEMGQRLGLHITAEGVERESQLEYLEQQECDDIQGYYFSRPLPAADYEKLISA